MAFLEIDETFSFIFSKYINLADIFFKDLIAKLLKYTEIHNDIINLVQGQQSPYRQIYNL